MLLELRKNNCPTLRAPLQTDASGVQNGGTRRPRENDDAEDKLFRTADDESSGIPGRVACGRQGMAPAQGGAAREPFRIPCLPAAISGYNASHFAVCPRTAHTLGRARLTQKPTVPFSVNTSSQLPRSWHCCYRPRQAQAQEHVHRIAAWHGVLHGSSWIFMDLHGF